MENEQKRKCWFFGSKLNTILLLILIILVVIALRWMRQEKSMYLPIAEQKEESGDHSKNLCGAQQTVKIISPDVNSKVFQIGDKMHIAWSTCNIENDGLGEYAVITLRRFDPSGKELFPSIHIADSSEARATLHSGSQDWVIPEYETFASLGDGYLVSLVDQNVKYKININITTKVFERGTPDFREAESDLFSISQ